MKLETARLILRSVASSDEYQIHLLHSMPEVDEYNTLGIPDSIDSTRQLVSGWLDSFSETPRKKYIFCIEDAAKTFIGLIGLTIGKPNYRNAEVWFKLCPTHWKKGYATEALNKILDFGFLELRLHRIEAGCAIGNLASKRVLEKVGMKLESHRRKVLPIRGGWVDNLEFAILEDDDR